MEIAFLIDKKIEDIYVFSSEDYFPTKVFSSRLWDSFCDLMSVDFANLINGILQKKYKLLEINKKSKIFKHMVSNRLFNLDSFIDVEIEGDEEDISNFLLSISPFFHNDFIIEAITEGRSLCDIVETINKFILIQMYVEQGLKNELLYERQVFEYYVDNVIMTFIPAYREIDYQTYRNGKDEFLESNDDYFADYGDEIMQIIEHSHPFTLGELFNLKREIQHITYKEILYAMRQNNLISISELREMFGNFYEPSIEENVNNFFTSDVFKINYTNEYIRQYDCNFYDEITPLIASLNEVIRNGYRIKKCANCGKYFIPFNRSDTIYCDRNSPQDDTKTCKEYGAAKAYQANLKANKAMGLYRKIYMQKQMLVKRNSDIDSYKNDFENFKVLSKKWKSDVKKKLKTETEYLSWLKSVRRKDDDD